MLAPSLTRVTDWAQMDQSDVTAARRYMRALARFWCGGTKGRSKLDPVYVGVTEGRDGPGPEQWRHYSSCGDLSEAMAFHMGVRKPWISRREYQGWQAGVNLTRFYDEHGPAVTPSTAYTPQAGDIGFIWLTGNDAHTFIFGDALDPGHIETFNYGAGGMNPSGALGAHQAASELHSDAGLIHIGSRILHKVLPVPLLLAQCDATLLPNMAGEIIDELEARIS